MTKLKRETLVYRSAEIVDVDVDNEKVMMDFSTGKYYGLPAVSTEIWARLEEPTSINSLITSLTSRYEISDQECETDVLEFLTNLKDCGLLFIAEADSP